nr:glycosyltransferase [uncultured Desulfobulbus sp.]
MKLITVVVPVFRVRDYLKECVDSILRQSYNNFELIIVDDHDDQDSINVISEYIKTDNRISCIRHKENKGLGPARNTGIQAAKGEYIVFIDSDDFVHKEYLRFLHEAFEKDVDIVQCGIQNVSDNGDLEGNPFCRAQGLVTGQCENSLFGGPLRVSGSAWNKMYRTELFQKNKIQYPAIIFEDVPTTYALLRSSRKVKCISDALYYYRIRPGSITQANTPEKICRFIQGLTDAQNNIEGQLLGLPSEDVFLQNYTVYLRNQYYKALRLCRSVEDENDAAAVWERIYNAIYQDKCSRINQLWKSPFSIKWSKQNKNPTSKREQILIFAGELNSDKFKNIIKVIADDLFEKFDVMICTTSEYRHFYQSDDFPVIHQIKGDPTSSTKKYVNDKMEIETIHPQFLTDIKNKLDIFTENESKKVHLLTKNRTYFNQILDRMKPDRVLIWSQFTPYSLLFYSCAYAHGVRSFSYIEYGVLPGTLDYDLRGQLTECSYLTDSNHISASKNIGSFRTDVEKLLRHIRRDALTRKVRRDPPSAAEFANLIKKIRSEKRLKILFLPENELGSPTSTLYGEKYYKDKVFPYEAPSQIIEFLNDLGTKRGFSFFIKPHPYSKKFNKSKGLPNVTLVNKKIHILDVIPHFDVILTTISQSAYESLIREIPVVVTGDFPLARSGAVVWAKTAETLGDAITEAHKRGFDSSIRESFILHIASMLQKSYALPTSEEYFSGVETIDSLAQFESTRLNGIDNIPKISPVDTLDREGPLPNKVKTLKEANELFRAGEYSAAKAAYETILVERNELKDIVQSNLKLIDIRLRNNNENKISVTSNTSKTINSSINNKDKHANSNSSFDNLLAKSKLNISPDDILKSVDLIKKRHLGKSPASDLSHPNNLRNLKTFIYKYVMYDFFKDNLLTFKNKHRGKRCFVVGNGPSLNQIDMKKLKNEITLGSNRVFLGFKEWGYSFKYWMCQDLTLIDQVVEEIRNLPSQMNKFIISDRFMTFETVENMYPFYIQHFPNIKEFPKFSNDIQCFYEGWTVTYALIQMAVYLGCTEIYLVGVDHSYNLTKDNYTKDGKHWNDPSGRNHFTKNYTNAAKGQKWALPEPERMEKAYSCAKEYCDKNGIKILNASPGTCLSVFPKISFDSIF